MKKRPELHEIKIRAVRSRGPGGQNVNKVSTAAQLRWPFLLSESFTEAEKKRLMHKLENYINKNDELVLRAEESRSLTQNKAAVYARLLRLVIGALKKPKPRKATKPSRAQKQKRLDTKSRRSDTKANRKSVKWG